MPRRIIGIDFREEALTAVVLRQGLRETVVEEWVELALPSPARGGAPAGLERWEAAWNTLSGRLPLAGSECVVGFPAHWASYRYLRMPFQAPKKIRQVLAFELEPLLPYPADGIVADIHREPSADGGRGAGFGAVAASRQQLEAFFALLEPGGAKPRVVSVGYYAAALAVMDADRACRGFLLVDRDGIHLNLCLVRGRRIQAMRSLPAAADAYRGDGGAARALQHAMLAAAGQGADTDGIEKVYVCGKAAGEPAVSEALAAGLDTAVEPLRLEEMVPRLVVGGDAGPPPPAVQSALALALTETGSAAPVNLRRGAFAESRLWARHRSSLVRTAVMLLLAAAAFSVHFGIDLAQKQKHHEQLRARIEGVFRSTFPEVQRVVDPEAQMQVNVREARRSIQRAGVQQDGVRSLAVLAEISRRVPPQLDVVLNRLDVSPETAMLAGDTSNFNAVDDLKRRLEESALFRSVDINSTTKSKSGDRVEFKMTIGLGRG